MTTTTKLDSLAHLAEEGLSPLETAELAGRLLGMIPQSAEHAKAVAQELGADELAELLGHLGQVAQAAGATEGAPPRKRPTLARPRRHDDVTEADTRAGHALAALARCSTALDALCETIFATPEDVSLGLRALAPELNAVSALCAHFEGQLGAVAYRESLHMAASLMTQGAGKD